MREISLDTETTGLDPKDGHRIVEIGCVEIIDKVKTGNVFHIYINPERDMPEGAFKVHGISEEFLQDKPKFAEIAEDFIDFIKDTNLVIHNAAFDMKFINFELRQCGLEIIERRFVKDSLIMARNKYPGAKNSLDALCKRFKIDLSRREKHGALLDADLLADVYVELLGGNQRTLFEEKKETKQEKEAVLIQKNVKILQSRNFTISNNDKELHEEFIKKNFKDNRWGY
ncbi:DNA polymerase III subunit epsilon [Rickettsiales bacterium]|nr:DNA polymerase III subunit epsilon [Rickettsiales bacterium]